MGNVTPVASKLRTLTYRAAQIICACLPRTLHAHLLDGVIEHLHRSGLLPDWQKVELDFMVERAKVRASMRSNKTAPLLNTTKYLEVGAASAFPDPEWITLDLFRGDGISMKWDCTVSLPLPDQSIEGIFAEHVFEHFDYRLEAPQFLSECLRVLKTGGTLRLIVPDAGQYLKAYAREATADLRALRDCPPDSLPLGQDGIPLETNMEIVNEVFRQQYEHRYAYDLQTLSKLLANAGFREVTSTTFDSGAISELLRDNPKRATESLYIEGKKDTS